MVLKTGQTSRRYLESEPMPSKVLQGCVQHGAISVRLKVEELGN